LEEPINRAELLHRNWKELEEKMLGFGAWSGQMRREILRQQLRFISAGLNRISLDEKLHERSYVGMLKVAVRGMEKALYPNPVLRFFAGLKAWLVDRPVQLKEFKAMREDNLLELKRFLSERGFGTLIAGLEREMDFERNRFGMRMTGELGGGGRIDMELQLAMDLNGRYRPTLIDAALVGSDGTRLNHDFLLTDPLDAPMVVNLMQGRAVCMPEQDGRGGEAEKWLQVHFDRGDSYLRNFNAGYGFSAEQLLSNIAVQFGLPGLSDDRLVEELKKGNQIGFIAGAPLNMKLLLEADPGSKSLTLRNELGDKLEIQELMEQKKAHEVKMGKGLPEVKMERSAGQGSVREKGIG